MRRWARLCLFARLNDRPVQLNLRPGFGSRRRCLGVVGVAAAAVGRRWALAAGKALPAVRAIGVRVLLRLRLLLVPAAGLRDKLPRITLSLALAGEAPEAWLRVRGAIFIRGGGGLIRLWFEAIGQCLRTR